MLARQIAIGFGIAFIFPLLVNYGVSTFYPAPETHDTIMVRLAPSGNATANERKTYNDERQKEEAAYQEAVRRFGRVLILVATPLGVAVIFVGVYLQIQAVGTGLIIGGIFTIAWGYLNYWAYLDNWVRFVLLLAGFAVLIFIGVRRTLGAQLTRDRSS